MREVPYRRLLESLLEFSKLKVKTQFVKYAQSDKVKTDN